MVANVTSPLFGLSNPVAALRGADPSEARAAREREAAQGPTARDAVDAPSGKAADLAASRESILAALAALDQALGAGREGVGALGEALDALRRGGGAEPRAEAALQRYLAAMAAGGPLLAGETLFVRPDPDSAPLAIEGEDLQGAIGNGEAGISLRTGPQVLMRLEGALARFASVAQRLDVHAGVLGAFEAGVADGVRFDLDAETARLAALQVRQGLSESGQAIANAAPASILGLFRGA